MNILKTKSKIFQDKMKTAPKNPGCYLFKDNKGKVIYIGKAKNLNNRVQSYFSGFKNLEERKKQMIQITEDVEFITVDSEVEAIILETNLIKKYKTKYNILYRDDKNYSWVLFEKKVKNKHDFPRIRIIRDTAKKNQQGDLFGPFPSQVPLKNILKKLRRIFPYASCNRKIMQLGEKPLIVKSSDSKPCLFYHIGLCNAPCASLQSSREYMKNFNNIKKFFLGKKNEILIEYEQQIKHLAKELKFEEANKLKYKLNEIKYVTAQIKIGSEVDDVVIADLQKTERQKALNDLIEKLKFPEFALSFKPNLRIECYDISNIQGTNPVGAMTVMLGGELKPDQYRRFRIKTFDTPNDFAMMQEVLERRLKHISNSEDTSLNARADLIIVDGGKGQLSSAYKILKLYNYDDIPIIGLAKKEEEIFKISFQFRKKINEFEPEFERIVLNKNSQALHMIQRIRDEAHRFGITYHKKLRSKKMLISQQNKNLKSEQ